MYYVWSFKNFFPFFAELMTSQKLQDFLYMVLVAGNFLNSVSQHFSIRLGRF